MPKSPNFDQKLSVQELGFQDLDSPHRPQVVNGVAFLSGPIDIAVLRDRVGQFVESNPQYRCRIVAEPTPGWKSQDDFELSRHCIEHSLSVSSEEDVLTYVANEAPAGLTDGPPWRIALIRASSGPNRPARHALAFWAHHSLVDGLQGMKLFSSLVNRAPRSSAGKLENHPIVTSDGEERIPVVSGRCVRLMTESLFRRRSNSPFTVPAGSGQRQTFSLQWSRRQFREARAQYGASFQELLLAVLSRGLGDYCRRRRYRRRLRAVLPLGRSENASVSFTTNRHDVGFIAFPSLTRCERTRLDVIRGRLEALRREQAANVLPTIMRFLGRLPGAVRKSVANRWSRQADLLISLIPGLCGQQIADAKVESLYAQPALPPGHSVVIGIVVTRHQVFITVQVDPSVIEDSQTLIVDLSDAFREMTRRVESDVKDGAQASVRTKNAVALTTG